jgi:adsorption protein B
VDIVLSIASGAEIVMQETALFAAAGFLLLGTSDLAVDFIWIGRTLKRKLGGGTEHGASAATLAPPTQPGRLAIFTPAWDEASVIGAMLDHTLATFGSADYLLYVGCYPNDPATIAAARAVADPRIRVVVGGVPGPTSKADCLNRLWERMIEDEAREGFRIKAVVLHDAEDVVHSAEPRLFDALVEQYDLVQLPVVPLIDPQSRWIAGHYVDEFAESHGKEMVVREVVGASLPSAGVGCALSRDRLARLALDRGSPFDPDSLTEDYELGLRIHEQGGREAFVRLPASRDRAAVATREHFPATLDAAVAQKARWMTGIALAGWDRLGWRGGVAERWMRLRDRQSLLAALVLAAAYLSLLLWVGLYLSGWPLQPFGPTLVLLIGVNSVLLGWRLAMRFGFVARLHGWREGLRALPRMVVGNIIAMLAARRAVWRYLGIRRSRATVWDKTAHIFPRQVPAE